MNNKNRIFTGIIAATLMMPVVSQATDDKPKDNDSLDLYYAVKIGQMLTESPDYGASTNLGVTVGKRLTNMFTAEGEYTTSISDGSTSGDDTFSISSLGAYAAYRPVDSSFKAKVGYVNLESEISNGYSSSDGYVSYGIGFGGDTFMVEYTIMGGDTGNQINYLSLGIYF